MLCKNYNGWTEGVKTVSMNNLLESHRHSNDIMTETDAWLWSHDDWGARPGQARAGVKSCKNSLDWGSCDELWSGDNWRGECDMISDDQQKHFSTSFYCQQPVKTFIMMIIMEQCRPSTSLLSTILLLLSCKCSPPVLQHCLSLAQKGSKWRTQTSWESVARVENLPDFLWQEVEGREEEGKLLLLPRNVFC